MDSTYPVHVRLIAVGMYYLFRTGKAPEVGAIVNEVGIRRREFYLHFRSKTHLHEELVRGHDTAVSALLAKIVDADAPVRDRIGAFLHRLMDNRLSYLRFERPSSMATSFRDQVGLMLRGLLREASASGALSVPDVGEAERAVLAATDRFLDDLPLQYADDDDEDGERDLTAEEMQVYEDLFEAHWAAILDTLSLEPVAAEG